MSVLLDSNSLKDLLFSINDPRKVHPINQLSHLSIHLHYC